jgi:DNA-binding NarL/FixJ family response regulator
MNKISILIADDHPLILLGLLNMINANEIFNPPYSASDGKTALNLILEFKPDIAILDVEMPFLNGFEVLNHISNLNLKTKVIFLTMYKERELFENALSKGAMGYLLKENALSELTIAIDSVLNGDIYVGKNIESNLTSGPSKIFADKSVRDQISKLTKTEKDILLLIAQQLLSKEIADKLFISESTVKNHRHNIIKKLEISGDQNSLLKFAINYSSFLK